MHAEGNITCRSTEEKLHIWGSPAWILERFKQEWMFGLSTKKKNGCCREVAIVERFKQEWMFGLSTKKRKMAVVERWPL